MWRQSLLEGHCEKNHDGRVLLARHILRYSQESCCLPQMLDILGEEEAITIAFETHTI